MIEIVLRSGVKAHIKGENWDEVCKGTVMGVVHVVSAAGHRMSIRREAVDATTEIPDAEVEQARARKEAEETAKQMAAWMKKHRVQTFIASLRKRIFAVPKKGGSGKPTANGKEEK